MDEVKQTNIEALLIEMNDQLPGMLDALALNIQRNVIPSFDALNTALYEALKPALVEYQTLAIQVKAFERTMYIYKRTRHIAHAAYGLRRRGSQGWRER